MRNKTQVHDAIVGIIVLLSIIAALIINMAWLWVAAIVAILLISSFFTGFCPVYYVLSKFMPEEE